MSKDQGREPPVIEGKAIDATPALSADAARPAGPFNWTLAFVLVSGVALALLGALYLHANDDAKSVLADLKRQSDTAAQALDARLKASDAKAQAALDKQGKDFEARLANAKTALEVPLSGTGAFDPAAFDKRLAEAEAKIAAAPLVAANPVVETEPKPPVRDAALVAGLAQVQGRLAEAEAKIAAAPLVPGNPVAETEAKAALAPLRDAALVAGLAEVQGKLAEFGATVADANAGQAALKQKAAQLEARIAAIEPRLAPLDAALAAIPPRLAPLEAALAAPKNQSRATEARGEGPQSGASAAAVAVIAQSILNALDRSAPFETEVAALENLGVEATSIAPLKPLSAKGAPGIAAFAAEIKGLSGAIQAAVAGNAEKSQSWMDKIGNNAASLVRVRRTDDTGGGDVPAVLARIDAALAQGNGAAALEAALKLPEAAKPVVAGWQQGLKARVAATAAARALLTGAIASLGVKKS